MASNAIGKLLLEGGWPEADSFTGPKEGNSSGFNDLNNSFSLINLPLQPLTPSTSSKYITIRSRVSREIEGIVNDVNKDFNLEDAYEEFKSLDSNKPISKEYAACVTQNTKPVFLNVCESTNIDQLSCEELRACCLFFCYSSDVLEESLVVRIIEVCRNIGSELSDKSRSMIAINCFCEVLRAATIQIRSIAISDQLVKFVTNLYKVLCDADTNTENQKFASIAFQRLMYLSNSDHAEIIKAELLNLGVVIYISDNLCTKVKREPISPPKTPSVKPSNAVSSIRLSLAADRQDDICINENVFRFTLALVLCSNRRDWDERFCTPEVCTKLWTSIKKLEILENIFDPNITMHGNLEKVLTPPSQKYTMTKNKNWEVLGGGRHGTVYLGGNNLDVAVKNLQVDDIDKFKKVFEEISVLNHLTKSGMDKCIKLLDFGSVPVASNPSCISTWIVMERATCSLLQYRSEVKSKKPMETSTFLHLLDLFGQVSKAVDELHSLGIVHNDIKCSNCLIAKRISGSFHVMLSDFGESCFISREGSGFLHESRGTECNKSPEMLKVCTITQALEKEEFDRRKLFSCGISFSTDVWSLGCLLFELLSDGSCLYEEAQTLWAKFFVRLTKPDENLDIIPEGRSELLRGYLAEQEYIIGNELLRFILVRDQIRRPTALAVCHRLENILQ